MEILFFSFPPAKAGGFQEKISIYLFLLWVLGVLLAFNSGDLGGEPNHICSEGSLLKFSRGFTIRQMELGLQSK